MNEKIINGKYVLSVAIQVNMHYKWPNSQQKYQRFTAWNDCQSDNMKNEANIKFIFSCLTVLQDNWGSKRRIAKFFQ